MREKSTRKYRVSASGFPRNRYVALEETRKLLGLTDNEFNILLKTFCKSQFSNLDFSFGDLSISFNTYCEDQICLTFKLERKRQENSIDYKFKPSDFGLPEKQRGLEDFEGE